MATEFDVIDIYDDNCVCTIPTISDSADIDPNCPSCIERSEICEWIFGCPDGSGDTQHPITGYTGGQALTDNEEINASVITQWADANIDNSDATKLKKLIVRGGISETDPTIIPGPKDAEYIGNSTQTLTMEIFPLCQGTYDFLRAMKKGGGTYPGWFKTIGGYQYGGENGICMSVTSIKFDKQVGTDTYHKAIVVMKWTAETDPPRDKCPV